jgi:protein involved in polysaccharide export with SLBB domain
MKKLSFASLVLVATLAMTASGQVKSVAAANNQSIPKSKGISPNSANATRVRVLGQNAKPKPTLSGNTDSAASLQAHAKSAYQRPRAAIEVASTNVAPNDAKFGPSQVDPRAASFDNNTTALPSNSVGNSTSMTALSQLYRVGVRDVLDIRLSENSSRESTLFTVLEDGLLEYPLADSPVAVVGLTTAEIDGLLRQRIKIFENPAVEVSVRDYASHTVTITGFVASPGPKVLRREAVPLYVMLAEASVIPEAARATITRQGRAPMTIDLRDPNLSSTLVLPGDVIKVSGLPPAPTEFFFVGGEINSPGQKPYHGGLTLTQAILASGGVRMNAGSSVRVSRQGPDGRLIMEEYNLRKIQGGKVPDPVLQKGDRIEVTAVD